MRDITREGSSTNGIPQIFEAKMLPNRNSRSVLLGVLILLLKTSPSVLGVCIIFSRHFRAETVAVILGSFNDSYELAPASDKL